MVHNFRRRSFFVVIALILVVIGTVGVTLRVFAEGSSGTGSGANGGSCAPSGSTLWWDTCYGVTWRRYQADNNAINIPGGNNTPGGTILNCKDNGGYYYRLAFEVYNPSTLSSLGYQKGLVPVNKVVSPMGSGFYNFRVVGDSKGWDEVKKNFETALAAGITGFSTKWEDTAWFCWDINLENPQMRFQSKSQVSGDGGTSTSPAWDADAPDLEVQADTNGKATVTFSHQLHYEAGTTTGEYENASTTWKITTDTLGTTTPSVWSTPGKVSADSSWLPENQALTVEVTLGDGETEKKVCSTIDYTTKTVKWDESNPHKMIPAGDSGKTTACAIVKKDPDVTPATGDILFWPQSSVESVAEKDVVNHKEWTSDDKNKADGDKVSMQLSTDYDTAKANFQHMLHVEVNMGYTFGANDTWDDSNMCSNYTVTLAGGGTKTGKVCAPSPAAGSSTASGVETIDGAQGHVVNVPGKAIEKIEYDNKTISISRKEIKYWGTCGSGKNAHGCWKSYNPKRWKYYGSGGSGSGNSSAEIEYVSPNEPDNSNGPSSGSGTDGKPMYAGESTGMTWWAKADAINTRRIIEFQSVVFQVRNSVPYNSTSVQGDIDKGLKYSENPGRDQNDPCEFWRRKLSPFRTENGGCAQIDAWNLDLNDTYPTGYVGEHRVNNEYRSVVVPDYVGDKYCNSFGYRWQYYYGVRKVSDGNTWDWRPESQTYWTHYDAACRTIAKKPSVAIWNGGLFSNGGISTSLASRYNYTWISTLASGSPNASFGSWAEHLGIASNGAILNFGTASSLAFGSGLIGVSTASNSSLSVRNDILLGLALIPPNPTLATRLGNYLGNLTGVTDVYDGDVVDINSSIVTSGSYSDVYQLPQKIIYAPNATQINIHSNVTEIDAWIIAPNATVDTCSNFQTSVTETQPGGNNPCDAPLQINGPVVAKSLKLNRTGGADYLHGGWAKYTPAEIFNLSADTYLWAYAQAGRYGSSYTEAYSRELPPRY